MSALYHIAQNEPPCLSTDNNLENAPTIPWSDRFVLFVEQCLRKDPHQRLSTNACLNVFIFLFLLLNRTLAFIYYMVPNAQCYFGIS